MTDQNSQFFAILTDIGRAKQANADALGTAWTFAQMGVGDANGTDPIPSGSQTKLINERRRAPLNQVKVDPTNASVIIAEQVIPESVGGWWVRELGLYDADGDLVAVANCAPTFKPLLAQGSGRTQVIRINLIVSNTANIELKIDPSVVLATREYVDTAVVEALARLDFKHSVLVATTTNIALNGIQTVDGMLLPVDARVLVKDQAQAKDNGIYVVPASGAWRRAQDADASVEVTPGLFVSVEKGTANGDSVWQLVTDAPIILGTTPLAFEVVAGRTGVVAGTYRSLTVDKLGRVIAGTNPTTLADYQISDAYKRTEVDFLLSSKANNAITLAGYGIGDAYTKTAVDSLLAGKAAKATTLGGYAITDAYTKTEVNNSLSQCIKFGQFIPVGSNPSFGSGVVGSMASITGTLGSLQVNGEVPGAPAVIALHRPGAFGTYFGLDTDNQLKLGGWSLGGTSYVIYHAGNFNPASKMNAMNCANAGFADNTASTPFMTHSDGTTVALQLRKPSDTALLETTGNSKNADTGEITQWFEVFIGNAWNSPLVKSIVWPSAFPTAFLNARFTFKQSSTAYIASTTVNYMNATKNGCDINIGQWQSGQDPTLTLVIEVRGK